MNENKWEGLLANALAVNMYASDGEASIMIYNVFQGFYSNFPWAHHPAARNIGDLSYDDSSYCRHSRQETLTSSV